MDRKRHEDQYQHEQQQQQSYNQHSRANKNRKRRNQPGPGARATTPIGSSVPPPPLGTGLTPAGAIKQMQMEREAGVNAGHVGDGDHANINNTTSNEVKDPGSKTVKDAKPNDNNLNGNTDDLSQSTSAGFVSANEGEDTEFVTNYNANAHRSKNYSNSSSVSAAFTDAREDSDDAAEVPSQKFEVHFSDVRNGNADEDEEELDEGNESSTPLAEEYTHASLIVNLSSDNNSSIDFRERRARVDLQLPEDSEPLSSARSAPPDLSHEAENMDEAEDDENDDDVQFLYSSTPSRPQTKSLPKPIELAAQDSIPVVTLDSTLELEDSVKENREELNESKVLQNQSNVADVSYNKSAAEVSADADTTSTTLENDVEQDEQLGEQSAAQSASEANSTTGTRPEVSLIESMLEMQMPEVAAEAGLPKTVTILQAANGTSVYLVGTAHFSEASQDDVIKTIREVQPKAVFLELCQARQHILVYDEETILREASNLNLEKVRFAIKKSGAIQGALHLLLLSISCSITKKLGMAPGGEFRVGFREAQKLRHQCDIIFGDRAFAVTLARALDSLTFWQKVKLAWQFLTTPNDITKEEIERCKEKDILEQMLEEMVGEYPSISHVFVGERDIYLAHSLWLSALATDGPVVGIVGIGHVPGITRQWGRTNETQVNEVNQMPKTSTTSIVIRKTIKIGFYCLVGYGVYRLGSRMISGTRLQAITLPESITTRLSTLKLSTFAKKY